MKQLKLEALIALGFGIGMVLPLLSALLFDFLGIKTTFHSIYTHSAIEMTGGIVAFILAIIFLSKLRGEKSSLWLACAFTAMGTFDFIHSLISPGSVFVWLHSLAVLAGGLFFALLWLPEPRNFKSRFAIVTIVFLAALLIGVLSVLYPNTAPLMVSGQTFSLVAILLNSLGGVLYIAAMFYFFITYNETSGGWKQLTFIIFSAFQAAAGIFFQFSGLWDAQWWFWHVLRLAGFMIIGISIIKSKKER